MENLVSLESKAWAMLAYLGPLSLWSVFKAKDDEFIRFHAKQGLVLFVLEVLVWALSVLPVLGLFLLVLGRLVFGLAVVFGLINAMTGEYKSLPVIGYMAEKFVL